MQLRDYMPKTLFGRMLAIILVPMIIVQIVTIFIFTSATGILSHVTWPQGLAVRLTILLTRQVRFPIPNG